jgi:flagellar motility protein MotE (MotC chaperone)
MSLFSSDFYPTPPEEKLAAKQREADQQEQEAKDLAAQTKAAIEKEKELYAATAQRRDAFVAALTATLTTMDPGTAARAIAEGTLHPAVRVDWSEV